MILGIDHLALSVSNTEEAKQYLEKIGFSCVFIESGIINHNEKKSLLSHYHPTHDIGIFRANNNGVAIEIVNHYKTTHGDTPYHYKDNYIELRTPDIDVEKNFWKTVFRFKEIEKDTLVFRSPILRWSCTIKMYEEKLKPHYTLDAQGYTCLAFLTNNINEDVCIAEVNGATNILSPFQLIVNKQPLEVSMFRTPGGAICELIMFRK